MRGSSGPILAILGVLIIGIFIAIAVVLITNDGDDDVEEPSVAIPGQTGGGLPKDAPEFIDAFPAESPDGEAMSSSESCEGDNRISWADAETHVNERVAILGPVTEITEDPDGTTELRLGVTEDETPVTIQLTQTAKRAMPAPPEELYSGQVVCVVGVLQAVGTQIEVFVNQPSDITIF